jgi:hypothetical protein
MHTQSAHAHFTISISTLAMVFSSVFGGQWARMVGVGFADVRDHGSDDVADMLVVDAVADRLARPLRLQKVRGSQEPQVVGGERLAEAGRLGDLSSPFGSLETSHDNLQSARLAEQAEHLGNPLHIDVAQSQDQRLNSRSYVSGR